MGTFLGVVIVRVNAATSRDASDKINAALYPLVAMGGEEEKPLRFAYTANVSQTLDEA